MSSPSEDLTARIYERLRQEMPRLRQEYPNTWIAYGIEGLLFPPEADKWSLFRKCQERGLKLNEYAFEATTPEEDGVITETEILWYGDDSA